MVAMPAFQPNRPTRTTPRSTRRARPRDAVTVAIVGILTREDRGVGDRFEQADAWHRGRKPRLDACAGRERPVA
jgi:hypothetical protein